MDQMWIFPVLAIVVEAMTEYAKNMAFTTNRKRMIIQAGALVLGMVICIAADADLFVALGIRLRIPWIGCMLTGIFVSRGANYVSDLLKTIGGGKADKEEVQV